MSEEERKSLCEKLRDPGDDPFTFQIEMLMEQAADEIERLAKEVDEWKREADKWKSNCRSMGWDVAARD